MRVGEREQSFEYKQEQDGASKDQQQQLLSWEEATGSLTLSFKFIISDIQLSFFPISPSVQSPLTFLRQHYPPLCAPLRMQQGVDSTRKKGKNVDTVGLAASDNKTIDGGSSKQPCVT